MKLPQKATENFVEILRMRNDALQRVAGVKIEFDIDTIRSDQQS